MGGEEAIGVVVGVCVVGAEKVRTAIERWELRRKLVIGEGRRKRRIIEEGGRGRWRGRRVCKFGGRCRVIEL